MRQKDTFSVVKFTENIGNMPESIVVVPSSWIRSDQVQYKQPPFNEEQLNTIETLVKNKTAAPEGWPMYDYIKLESFPTYKGAMTKLKTLRQNPQQVLAIENRIRNHASKKETNRSAIENSEEVHKINKEIEQSLSEEQPPQLTDCLENKGVPNKETVTTLTSNPSENVEIPKINNAPTVTSDLNTNSSFFDTLLLQFATKKDFQEFTLSVMNSLDNLSKKIDNISNTDAASDPLKDLLEKTKNISVQMTNSMTLEANRYRNLKTLLNDLIVLLTELKTLVLEDRTLVEQENIVSLAKLKEKHSLTLPLSQKGDFLAFNEKLIDNNIKKKTALYDDLKKHFISTVSTKMDLATTVTTILKNFFSKECMKGCVAQRSTGDKVVFKDTNFYTCMYESLLSIFKQSLQERSLLQAIGGSINCADDWGGRDRKSQQLENQLEQQKNQAADNLLQQQDNSQN